MPQYIINNLVVNNISPFNCLSIAYMLSTSLYTVINKRNGTYNLIRPATTNIQTFSDTNTAF